MLLLLPPSEGKTSPTHGASLDLPSLSSPALNPVRERILANLVRTSATKKGSEWLGLTPGQVPELERNTRLHHEPAGRADAVYTGVLYEAWNPAHHRADSNVAIASALFGVLRPNDRIPAYRLSGDVRLPRLGPVAALWRRALGPVLAELTDGGLLVDLRSGMYVNLHKPAGDLARRTASIRVLHNGKVVSHFNKATKGRIVRAVVESGERADTPTEFADLLRALGWTVKQTDRQLDVLVDEI